MGTLGNTSRSILLLGFVLVCLSTTSAKATLIAHWDFNPTDLFNDVANGHDPTTIHEVNLVPDRFGNPESAAHFTGEANLGSGATSHLLIPNSPALAPTLVLGEALRLSFWFRIDPGTFDDDAFMHLFDYINGSTDIGWGLSIRPMDLGADEVTGFGGGGISPPSLVEVADGNWHFLSTDYEGGSFQASLSVDGNLLSTWVSGPVSNPINPNFAIGNAGHTLTTNNHNFVGFMDDIRFEQITVPEPGTGLLLTVTLAALICGSRRD